MHVLLLALNYHPDKLGNAPLMTGIAEGLVERGHRVTVVCALPHHETGRIDPAYGRRAVVRDRRRGVDILRVWLYAPGEGGLLGTGAAAKMANYASFTATALAAALTVRDIDVIFTPSPPLTLGIVDHLVGRLRRVPFVYNLQDLFPEAAVRLGVLTDPRLIAGFERLERWVYRRATRLSIISEAFREHLIERGVPAERIVYIPNYTDTDEITPRARTGNPIRAAHGLDDTFVIQFSGRMGYSQGLETVIEAWRTLDDLPDARLMMVGDGQARAMIDDALRDDPRAVVLPTQPRAVLADLLGAADVGLAPLRRGMAETCIPSKIFGIMAAARPVIAGVEAHTDTARLIESADGGIVVPPEDPDALAAAIRRLYARPKLGRAMGAAGRLHVVGHHGRHAIIARYEALLEELVERGR